MLDNFFNNADAIDGIVDDMYTLDWFRQTMDLYEFYRTADLKEFSWQRNIKAVYELLTDQVMKWVYAADNFLVRFPFEKLFNVDTCR